MATIADPASIALSDASLASVCACVLEHMCIGVVACNDQLVVLAATPTATRLLLDFTLPSGPLVGLRLAEPIRQAVVSYLQQVEDPNSQRRVAPHRVESADARIALYVASKHIDGARPATIAVRLYRERLTDIELFEALRTKYDLNARDRRVIAQLHQRLSNAEIASALDLTVGTVKVYVHELFEKFGVHSRGELLTLFDQIRNGESNPG